VDLEVGMSFLGKYKSSALIAFLFCGLALPYSQAQAQPEINILRLFPDGAYLGIQMEDIAADNMSAYKLKEERGVIIRSVDKGSPAETAKLQEEDVILEFAGYPVWSTSQFSRLVRETPPGRVVDLVISRDGKRMNLSVQLASRGPVEREPGGGPMIFRGPDNRSFRFQWPDVPDGRFALPAEPKPRLGVTLQPLTDQLGEYFGVPGKKGALVSSVIPDTPSDGKLKSGDVIIKAGDRSIDDPDDLVRFIRDKAEGTITLKVIRDKKEISVSVNLPDDRGEEGYKL
jgi:serine protease Do